MDRSWDLRKAISALALQGEEVFPAWQREEHGGDSHPRYLPSPFSGYI